MSSISPRYTLDLMESPVSIKSPAGVTDREAHDRFERSLDLFHIGVNFEEEGQPEKAIAFFSESIDANPNMSLALLRRGKLFLESGMYNEALADFFSYRNQQPQCPRVLLYLSRLSAVLYEETKDEFHKNNAARYLDWAVQKNLHYSMFRIDEN
ncbi:MAG TPA: hypothetical protein DEP18_06855 [Flavobacteriales bacterium]|nr:hypothetical protein [Flavobacteriales bacterium]HRE74673.1 tetratricopeptide repeat protein [Flavobacteriales bacterium]HRE98097.1 tetratricopeptide repeat protein [Flavobacteriales bacterium]HRJ34887.1 tetratricopeptide repeat protein [Flavobacteriales bacterium]HRJ39473.1 tetratricopeptide repeat protein [Flavobacteriales bacterium]